MLELAATEDALVDKFAEQHVRRRTGGAAATVSAGRASSTDDRRISYAAPTCGAPECSHARPDTPGRHHESSHGCTEASRWNSRETGSLSVFEGPRDRRRRRLRAPLKSALHLVDRPLWTFTRRRYQPFDGVELLVSRTRSHEADVIDTGEPRLDAAYADWFDQSEEHEYFFRTTGPALIDPRQVSRSSARHGSCSTR